MRVTLVDTDYPSFLSSHYRARPGLAQQPYEELSEVRRGAGFGIVEPYRRELAALGHTVDDVYLSDWRMQRAWAREHGWRGRKSFRPAHWQMRRGFVPILRQGPSTAWLYEVLVARLREHAPDVLLILDMTAFDAEFLASVRKIVARLIGQHAATSLARVDLSPYDLVLSSFPPTVDFARQRVRAEYLPLAFDANVLDVLPTDSRPLGVTFIGSLAPVHSSRAPLLALLAERVEDFSWWSPHRHLVRTSRALRASYRGDAWGLDMYRILGQSRITINHHGDIPPYANNMRMFEATGMGAALLTESQPNLSALFDVGTEAVGYSNADECVARAQDLLEHPEIADGVAAAGQARTLRDHTWADRAPRVMELIEELG